MLLSVKFLRHVHIGRKKLLSIYLGPFEVLAKKGAAAYELRLPASMGRMFDVVYVSLLKKYRDGCRPGNSAPPPAVSDDGETESENLAHCDTKTGRRLYYVQWQGLPPEENECMTASRLKIAVDVVQAYLHELKTKGQTCCKSGQARCGCQ